MVYTLWSPEDGWSSTILWRWIRLSTGYYWRSSCWVCYHVHSSRNGSVVESSCPRIGLSQQWKHCWSCGEAWEDWWSWKYAEVLSISKMWAFLIALTFLSITSLTILYSDHSVDRVRSSREFGISTLVRFVASPSFQRCQYDWLLLWVLATLSFQFE